MKVNIVNKSKHNLPAYATPGAAGMDLKADLDEPIVLGSLERQMVPTGLHIKLPDGYEARVQPRSGLAAKYGVTVCNTPGCVDADYTGEIKVILINLSKDKFVINPGDRIAQLIVSKFERVEWNEVSELNPTERGEGGFGSTGK